MTFITVATAHDSEWNKDAAVRAAATERVVDLVGRLVTDLAHLDDARQPRFDYLDTPALDAIRTEPETLALVGRLAMGDEAFGERCTAATYWPEEGECAVEVEIAEGPAAMGPDLVPLPFSTLSWRLHATVDPVAGRITGLDLREL